MDSRGFSAIASLFCSRDQVTGCTTNIAICNIVATFYVWIGRSVKSPMAVRERKSA